MAQPDGPDHDPDLRTDRVKNIFFNNRRCVCQNTTYLVLPGQRRYAGVRNVYFQNFRDLASPQ